jgi:hypothetical protein
VLGHQGLRELAHLGATSESGRDEVVPVSSAPD